MDYTTALNRIISDGIEAARRSYAGPGQENKLEGAVAGFEACQDKSPEELRGLLTESRRKQNAAYGGDIREYWKLTCYAAEVEWVCNCVSAILVNEGQRPIIPPTARGTLQAHRALTGALAQ